MHPILQAVKDGWKGFRMMYLSGRRDRFGEIHSSSKVYQPYIGAKQHVFLGENTVIHEGARFICQAGRFIMKHNSTASFNFTVITFNHHMGVGDMPNTTKGKYGQLDAEDVIVEDGVLIGANVTLLPGAHISRGCIVGANTIISKHLNAMPYTVIAGNPGKVIKYRFTLEEQLEHERLCYPNEKDRIPEETLRQNFEKFLQNKDKKCHPLQGL